MAVVKWAAPGTRSANLAGAVLNSLANGSESAVIIFDNSTARDLYAALTLKLGSITPAGGGAVTVRGTVGDGVDVADRVGGDIYAPPILQGAGAKTIIIPMVRLYPMQMRFSFLNQSGVTFAATGNELYLSRYGEEVG